MDEATLRNIRLWVQKAEEDLMAAQTLFQAANPGLRDAVCFHAQQAAEKYLKAYLLFLQLDVPRVHELGYLLELALEKDPGLSAITRVETLSIYAVATRYPGLPVQTSLPEVEDAIAAARMAVDYVKAKLPPQEKA